MAKKKVTVFDLTDEQIEECFDGSSDVDLVKRLFEKCYLKKENIVDEEFFGEAFARAIEGFIDADPEEEPEEWQEAYETNQEWGETIAVNANLLVKELNAS